MANTETDRRPQPADIEAPAEAGADHGAEGLAVLEAKQEAPTVSVADLEKELRDFEAAAEREVRQQIEESTLVAEAEAVEVLAHAKLQEILDLLQDIGSLDQIKLGLIHRSFETLSKLRSNNPDAVNKIVAVALAKLDFYQIGAEDLLPEIRQLSEMIDEYQNREHKSGERVYELEGKKNLKIQPHPKGFVVQEGSRLILNGNKTLYEGKFDEWYPHPHGVVVRVGDRFMLNGKEEIFSGKYDQAWGTVEGIMILNGATLFIDGKEKTEIEEEVETVNHGMALKEGTIYSQSRLFKVLPDYEGKVVRVYERSEWLGKIDSVYVDEGEITNDTTDKRPEIYPAHGGIIARVNYHEDDRRRKVKEPTYRYISSPPTRWKGDTRYYGEIEKGKIFFVGKADQELIYPGGLILRKGKALSINGEVVCEGQIDELKPHAEGALVRTGTEWRIFKPTATIDRL